MVAEFSCIRYALILIGIRSACVISIGGALNGGQS